MCSDWFFLGQDFAIWTVSMEMVKHLKAIDFFYFGSWEIQKKTGMA